MRISLRGRILVAMLAVSALTAVVTAAIVRSQTINSVQSAVTSDLSMERHIVTEIELLGRLSGTWDKLPRLLTTLHEESDLRIAVTDLDGHVVADTDPKATLPPSELAYIDPFSSSELLASASTSSAATYSGTRFTRLEACVNAAGVDLEALEPDTDTQALDAASNLSDSDSAVLTSCANTTLPNPATASAEPLLLYTGYRADALADLTQLDKGQLLLALGGVILVSGLIALMLSSRISRPIGRLTNAVNQLGRGDLSQRVDEKKVSVEVAELSRAFNAMAADLSRSEQARARMVSDVAHELRNPVGVLQGTLEAAQDGVFATDRDLIDTLHSEVLQLATLVGDLQQLALADAGGLVLASAPTDLNEVASHAVLIHQSLAAERSITLANTGSDDTVTATVDRTRIQQVLTNLLSNALQYTPSGGAVTVGVSQRGAEAVIEVTDTGIGMTRDEVDHAFDRFWRADSSRNRNTGGTGVGLAVCDELVRAHGGTIEISSIPWHGTTFTVRLPLG